MEFSFAREVRSQIHEMDSTFKNGLLRSWPGLNTFVKRMEGDPTWDHLPVLTLMFHHYLGVESSLATSMAGIMRNLYLAQSIHSWVKDDEEGQDYNQELQFSILIGDYMFGYILKMLLENRSDSILSTLSAMICTISEGLVRKHRFSPDPVKALKETKAPLYATAFQTAAELSGNVNDAPAFGQIGHHLGMAVELLHLGMNSEADKHVHSGFELLSAHRHRHSANSGLDKAIQELHDHSCRQGRAAVI